MSATVNLVVFLYSMADNARSTMRAFRREGLDRTFEAVKDVIVTVQSHLERLVVVVATRFAYWHGCLPNET
ncbi:MAG: hypothetical protein WAL01_20785 [Pseudolabrys sp.]